MCRTSSNVAGVSWLLADLGPLRESPSYRWLLLGQSLSLTGSSMTRVAVAVQVYALTGSSLAVGLVGLATALPLLVLGLLGGSVADAVDRRRLVLASGSALAVCSLTLAGQALAGLRLLWLLYLLVAVQSALNAVQAPASRTFAARLLACSLLSGKQRCRPWARCRSSSHWSLGHCWRAC